MGEEGGRGHGGGPLGRPGQQGGDPHHTLLIPLHPLLGEQVNNHDGIVDGAESDMSNQLYELCSVV